MTLALFGESSWRRAVLVLGAVVPVIAGATLSFGEWHRAHAGQDREVRVQKATPATANPGGTFTVTVRSKTFSPGLNANQTVGAMTAPQEFAKNTAATGK